MFECNKCWAKVSWNNGWTHDVDEDTPDKEFDHKAINDSRKAHAKDECYCPDCGLRRVLYPLHQNVSSWADPKALWIHTNGLRECV